MTAKTSQFNTARIPQFNFNPPKQEPTSLERILDAFGERRNEVLRGGQEEDALSRIFQGFQQNTNLNNSISELNSDPTISPSRRVQAIQHLKSLDKQQSEFETARKRDANLKRAGISEEENRIAKEIFTDDEYKKWYGQNVVPEDVLGAEAVERGVREPSPPGFFKRFGEAVTGEETNLFRYTSKKVRETFKKSKEDSEKVLQKLRSEGVDSLTKGEISKLNLKDRSKLTPEERETFEPKWEALRRDVAARELSRAIPGLGEGISTRIEKSRGLEDVERSVGPGFARTALEIGGVGKVGKALAGAGAGTAAQLAAQGGLFGGSTAASQAIGGEGFSPAQIAVASILPAAFKGVGVAAKGIGRAVKGVRGAAKAAKPKPPKPLVGRVTTKPPVEPKIERVVRTTEAPRPLTDKELKKQVSTINRLSSEIETESARVAKEARRTRGKPETAAAFKEQISKLDKQVKDLYKDWSKLDDIRISKGAKLNKQESTLLKWKLERAEATLLEAEENLYKAQKGVLSGETKPTISELQAKSKETAAAVKQQVKDLPLEDVIKKQRISKDRISLWNKIKKKILPASPGRDDSYIRAHKVYKNAYQKELKKVQKELSNAIESQKTTTKLRTGQPGASDETINLLKKQEKVLKLGIQNAEASIGIQYRRKALQRLAKTKKIRGRFEPGKTEVLPESARAEVIREIGINKNMQLSLKDSIKNVVKDKKIDNLPELYPHVKKLYKKLTGRDLGTKTARRVTRWALSTIGLSGLYSIANIHKAGKFIQRAKFKSLDAAGKNQMRKALRKKGKSEAYIKSLSK